VSVMRAVGLVIMLLLAGCASLDLRDRQQLCAERALRKTTGPFPPETLQGLTWECAHQDGRACSVLGVVYETGQLTPVNRQAAQQLYRTACQLGNRIGCENLTAMGN